MAGKKNKKVRQFRKTFSGSEK